MCHANQTGRLSDDVPYKPRPEHTSYRICKPSYYSKFTYMDEQYEKIVRGQTLEAISTYIVNTRTNGGGEGRGSVIRSPMLFVICGKKKRWLVAPVNLSYLFYHPFRAHFKLENRNLER